MMFTLLFFIILSIKLALLIIKNLAKEMIGGVIYRPFSPPFQQLTSEQSDIEEVLDTDFVPTRNIDD